MRLTALEVWDWRNLRATQLDTGARFVVLHGDNGQGKTNLLEAAGMLATLRSFREARAARLIRQGAPLARIVGQVQGSSGLRRLEWRRGVKERALLLDGEPQSTLTGWFGVIRAILFHPELAELVRGEPAGRRELIDRAAFTAEPGHLELVRAYHRIVQHKSALLRRAVAHAAVDHALLDTLDEQLCHTGARLIRRRERVIAGLGELVDEAHGAIAGVPGKVGIRRVGPAASDLTAAVEAARGDELRRGIVLVGPHRDDIELTLAGQPARAFASQGQARTLVLALKLAEVLAAARRGGDPPLFLLDDLTSELDRRRMERLVALLATLPHQVWITTTDPAWLGPLPAADTARLRVVEGTAAPG